MRKGPGSEISVMDNIQDN